MRDESDLEHLDDAEVICRRRGGRLTRQRRAVLRALLEGGRPMTAYELLDAVRETDGAVTPASTYRSLDFLLQMGLVHRLQSTKSYVPCDHPEHPHAGQFLICRRCGTVVEAEDPRLARAATALRQRHGFTVDQETVEFTGVCGACGGGEVPLSGAPPG
jgi:Fur family zinc uptake transcriptional regulator